MEILARAVGRRKEAVAQVQLVRGNGQFLINNKPAQAYLQNNSCSLICIQSPLEAALSLFSSNVSIPLNSPLDGNVEEDGASLEGEQDLTGSNQLLTNVKEGVATSFPPAPTDSEGKEVEEMTSVFNSLPQLASSVPFSPGEREGNGKEEETATSLTPILSNTDLKSEEGVFNWGARQGEIDILVKVKGGGLIGQAEAIKLAVARAFCIMENVHGGFLLRKILKTKGYLTQDSRVKERKKYGLKKARKASQYHKR